MYVTIEAEIVVAFVQPFASTCMQNGEVTTRLREHQTPPLKCAFAIGRAGRPWTRKQQILQTVDGLFNHVLGHSPSSWLHACRRQQTSCEVACDRACCWRRSPHSLPNQEAHLHWTLRLYHRFVLTCSSVFLFAVMSLSSRLQRFRYFLDSVLPRHERA